jgi:hypothetical protein
MIEQFSAQTRTNQATKIDTLSCHFFVNIFLAANSPSLRKRPRTDQGVNLRLLAEALEY